MQAPENILNLDSALISPAPTFRAWCVCIAASLFFFYEFVQMMMFNTINPDLMLAFSVNATHLGILSSAYFYANIICMFPAGILLDRFSTKKIILIAMVLCVLGTLLFSFATSLILAVFCRFLTGIGGSFPFLCCLRLASRWFTAKRMALVSGTMVTIAMLGGATGQTPLTLLVNAIGWRHSLQLDALLGCIFIFIIFLVVQDAPLNYKAIHQITNAQEMWQGTKKALTNLQNWLCGIYTCLLNLPIFLLGAIWGSLYLTQVYHLTKTHASLVTTMIFFGTIVGSPTIGWFSDKIRLRRLPMIIGALLSLVIIFLIMYASHLSFLDLISLFFLLGFITSSQIISYPTIAESNSIAISGSALGLASVLIMSGGAFFQPLFGKLMDLHWDGLMINKIPYYSLADYRTAFIIMPIAFIISLVAAFFIKETYCKHTKA